MKKVWIPSIILSVFLGGCFVNPSNLQVSVITGAEEHDFKVQIADSLEERTKGLQQVAELSDEEGMWFVFDHPQNLSFWMKDTFLHHKMNPELCLKYPLQLLLINQVFYRLF